MGLSVVGASCVWLSAIAMVIISGQNLRVGRDVETLACNVGDPRRRVALWVTLPFLIK